MVNPLKIEYAKVHVEDLTEAAEFYTNVLELVELGHIDKTVYFGCGRDSNVDLAIQEGGTGLDHVAFRIGSGDTLEKFSEKLEQRGFNFDWGDGDIPGETQSLRLLLPSGFKLKLVVLEDAKYPHSDEVAYSSRTAITPLDFDHVNIRSPNLKEDVTFLVDHLGFHISEIIGTKEEWDRAFIRCNEKHHDIAMGPRSPDASHASLHHLSFKYADVDHMKRVIDRIVMSGIELEREFGRHFAGDNLFSYFWSPCGNRVELTAEMATIYSEETVYLPPDISAGTAWGSKSPESFHSGSGIVGHEE